MLIDPIKGCPECHNVKVHREGCHFGALMATAHGIQDLCVERGRRLDIAIDFLNRHGLYPAYQKAVDGPMGEPQP